MNIMLGRRFFVALTVVAISAVVFQASYFQDRAEAYLFPAIVAAVMLVLSLLSLARETFDLCVDDYQPFPFVRQLPAIVLMGTTVYLVEVLGTYASAFIGLLAVTWWYSADTNGTRRAVRSLAFAVGFSAFMYLLFSVLLNVQLPRGVLI
jgi:hypothetical protein